MLHDNYYIKHNEIPLYKRIDDAWDNYLNKSDKNSKEALEFLVYAFDLPHFNDSKKTNYRLTRLMEKKNKYGKNYQQYIPGKIPRHLEGELRKNKPLPSYFFEKGYSLKVRETSKLKDLENKPPMYHREQRAPNRVLIHNGKFYKKGTFFNSSIYSSHNKKNFAAFTLNLHGELSIFNHPNTPGGLVHSSMNAGADVIGAGEVLITDGKLIAINNHSGHYLPSLYNLYQVLRYFEDRGIDISETEVRLISKPEGLKVEKPRFKHVQGGTAYFHTTAKIVINTIDAHFNECADKIFEHLESYLKDKASVLSENRVKNIKTLLKEVDTIIKNDETIKEKMSSLVDEMEYFTKNALKKDDEETSRLRKIISSFRDDFIVAERKREQVINQTYRK